MAETKNAGLQLCSVRAGDGLFGIDTRKIREVLGDAHPQRVPLAPQCIAGVMAYRGEMLTVVGLRSLLGLAEREGRNRVLVLEDDEVGEPFGLLVDEVGGVVSVAEGAMESNPATLGEREMALLNGVTKTPAGLMARLEAARLRPSEAARGGSAQERAVAR